MKLLLILLLLSFTIKITAKTSKKIKNKVMEDTDNFVFIPGLAYSTSDGIKVNGTGLYYDKSNSISFPNSFRTNISYGSQNEFSFGLGTKRYFFNQKYKISSYFTTGRYPSTLYYPLGGKKNKKEKESFLSSNNYFGFSIGKRKYKYFYLGIAYNFAYYKITEKKENGIIDNNKIIGSENTIASGIGFYIIREKRNNSYYPTKGYYIYCNNYIYPTFIGSNTFYDTSAISFKYFHSFYKITIAFQVYTRAVFGNAPFQKYSQLGGSGLLRGYSSYKYIDRRYFATQLEIRYPVFWRISGTAFLGTAQVTNSFLNYFDYPWKLAGGLGFRFRLDKKQNINFRLDIAWNIEGEMHIYITSLEAF